MKRYIRTKDGKVFNLLDLVKFNKTQGLDEYEVSFWKSAYRFPEMHKLGLYVRILKQSDTIEDLCDCFVKIKRKGNCKPYILKFDHKDLPTLKEQAIKYKDGPVYGAIHIEDKGLIYVAKMNDKGELELLWDTLKRKTER